MDVTEQDNANASSPQLPLLYPPSPKIAPEEDGSLLDVDADGETDDESGMDVVYSAAGADNAMMVSDCFGFVLGCGCRWIGVDADATRSIYSSFLLCCECVLSYCCSRTPLPRSRAATAAPQHNTDKHDRRPTSSRIRRFSRPHKHTQ